MKNCFRGVSYTKLGLRMTLKMGYKTGFVLFLNCLLDMALYISLEDNHFQICIRSLFTP